MSERDRNIIETLREGNRNLRNELNDAKARIAYLEEQVNRATMLVYSDRAQELAACYLADWTDLRARAQKAEAELAQAREVFQNTIELCRLAERYFNQENYDGPTLDQLARAVRSWAEEHRALLDREGER